MFLVASRILVFWVGRDCLFEIRGRALQVFRIIADCKRRDMLWGMIPSIFNEALRVSGEPHCQMDSQA